MPASVEEVRQLISEAFPGSDVEDVKDENYHVTGTIMWQGFKGLDAGARNLLVTEKVRRKLGSRGMNVGFLIPLVPGEL